jgi:hypothetical protein
MKPGVRLVSHIQPAKNTDLLDALKAKQATVVGMDTLPRMISRAQTFDSMSSQVRPRIGPSLKGQRPSYPACGFVGCIARTHRSATTHR